MFSLIDAVKQAKVSRFSFSPKRYNKWYVYLAIVSINSLLIQPVAGSTIRKYLVQAYKIPFGAMRPTLLVGDHILVNKFIYGIKIPFLDVTLVPIKEPERGDIVVFEFPEDPKKDFIKRVIAVGGDTVEIRNKTVYINHKLFEDPYGTYLDPHIIPGRARPRDNFGPVTVPYDSLFVMGDNRDHSYDSRFWGFVKQEAVKGKAVNIYWSWDRQATSVRWGRIGKHITYRFQKSRQKT